MKLKNSIIHYSPVCGSSSERLLFVFGITPIPGCFKSSLFTSNQLSLINTSCFLFMNNLLTNCHITYMYDIIKCSLRNKRSQGHEAYQVYHFAIELNSHISVLKKESGHSKSVNLNSYSSS